MNVVRYIVVEYQSNKSENIASRSQRDKICLFVNSKFLNISLLLVEKEAEQSRFFKVINVRCSINEKY